MAVLQKGKSNYPFWGSSISLITGLDPLGLQITSESAYSTMLPGISNLTNRIRYYGFYCWLLDFYYKREQKGNSQQQYRFIRRSELMIAIIMQKELNTIAQITGSSFATNMLYSNTGEPFDLELGADKDGTDKSVYWKYPSGAFGQYYFGPMRSLALVNTALNEDGDSIFVVSQPHPRQKVSGKQLADAFDDGLNPQIKDLFYNNIIKGKLNPSDIPKLIEFFAIDKIDSSTAEWQLYVDMLLDKDDPSQEIEESFSFHRKETIHSLINSSLENNNEFDWYNYLLSAYDKKLGTLVNPVNETSIGWYCYQFNEYWQFACGTLFWSILHNLYKLQQDQYLPAFTKSFTSQVVKEICKELKLPYNDSLTIKEVLAKVNTQNTEESLLEKIDSEIKSGNQVEAAKYGLLLLFQLFINNKEQLPQLKEYMSQKQFLRDGNMVEGINILHTAQDEPFQEFAIRFFRDKVLSRHQFVALRKMGNGTQATYKFIVDEQMIRFIENYPPRNTSPRMYALQNLLFDLQVIDSNKNLTQLYNNILL